MHKIVMRNNSNKLMDSGRQTNQAYQSKILKDDSIELTEVCVIKDIPSNSRTSFSMPPNDDHIPHNLQPMNHSIEQHVNLLMSKSFYGHDVREDDQKREHVLNAYKFLTSSPFFSIILMIVASSSKIKSVFDFNRDSVHVADPTVPSNTKGMFYLSGRVYIGAKQMLDESMKYETYATLAHEFCHYAMDLTYRNFARPYAKNDSKTKQEFEEISQKCRNQPGIEEYIDLVYDYYPPVMHHAELIVRVPHLMAMYHNQPERLQEVREKFIELFEFYENKILAEMEKALPDIEIRDQLQHEKKEKKIIKLKKIACISFILTIVGIIVAVIITSWLNKKTIYSFKELSDTNKLLVKNGFINYKNIEVRMRDLFPENSTAYEKLTSDHISQIFDGHPLNFSDPHFLYLNNFVHHDWKNLTQNLKQKFLTSNFTFQNENLKLEKLKEINSEVFNSLTSEQIVDVLDGKELVVGHMIENKIEFYVERRFVLEEDGKLDIVRGVENKVEKGSQKVEQTTIAEGMGGVVEISKVTSTPGVIGTNKLTRTSGVGKMNTGISTSRDGETTLDTNSTENLKYETVESNLEQISKSSDEIIEEIMNERLLILSSEIGSGMTTTFQKLTMRIKKKLPTKWVYYVDLKDGKIEQNLKKILKNSENFGKNSKNVEKIDKKLENIDNATNQTIENIIDFFVNILDLNSKNQFEFTVFNNLFKSGDVVLLWDNFDELSHKNKKKMINIFNETYKHTKNVQFIASMPLFATQLHENLGVKIYEPVPFTETEQKLFFKSFFSSQNLTQEKIENFTEGAFNISRTLQLDSPLMQKFIAQNYETDKLYQSPNFYNICFKFVSQKIEMWSKSESGKNLTSFLLSKSTDFDMMKMYQRIAFQRELDLNLVLNTTKPEYQHLNELRILKIKIPNMLKIEEIARMGILSFKSENDYKFLHKTIADFFFAKYIIDNLYSLEDNVSKTEKGLRVEIFRYLLDNYDGSGMIVTLIRHYLKENSENIDKSQEFLIKNFREIFDKLE